MNDLVVGLHKELRQFNLVSIKNRFGSGFFTDIARLQRPINKTISISHCKNKNGSAKIEPAYISMNQQKHQQQKNPEWNFASAHFRQIFLFTLCFEKCTHACTH